MYLDSQYEPERMELIHFHDSLFGVATVSGEHIDEVDAVGQTTYIDSSVMDIRRGIGA